ncbi:MAG: hypothetical protein KC618_06660 [Candidatus Omnitrophica bacterium]|nr:hypothetical protein [Candidatus Omnitrophota bacterium]
MTKSKNSKLKDITVELIHHLPYSIFGVVLAFLLLGILNFIVHIAQAEAEMPHAAEEMFHIFHPMHVLISAVATTAMFWKHDNRNVFKALIVGFLGSVTICGISDVIVPYLGGIVLGYKMGFHICLIEEPSLVYPFAVIGVLAGLAVTKSFDKSTQYSHGTHVFISSVASLLYLISFGVSEWTHAVGSIFIVTLVAVMFPCCLSDIVFPMICTHRYCQHSEEEGRHIHH